MSSVLLLLHLVPIFYFLSGLENTKGGIELLSSSDSYFICPGEELTLTCETNETEIEILQWNLDFPSEEIAPIRNNIPIIGNLLPESFIRPTTHGGVTFTFYRTSDTNTYPLVTELVINEVNIGINGMEISCSRTDLTDRHTTIIDVIDGGIPESPVVNITDNYHLGMTNVTVIVEWAQENGVTFNVHVHPTIELEYIRHNSLLLTISYNIQYHINIVAIRLCGQYNATTTLTLNYVACSHHIPLHQGIVSDIPITMTDVVHEGINMTLSCLFGLVLVGSNTSTCTENGQWEPDPKEVECVHLACIPPSPPPNGYINFHSSERSITFVCQNSTIAEEVHIISHCNSFGKWVPNPTEFCSGAKQSSDINVFIIIGSSLSCFILTSVICLLFLGCCCCLIHTRYKNKQTVERISMAENDGSVPIYEDLLPSVTIKSNENELKLKENVAYNSLEITCR